MTKSLYSSIPCACGCGKRAKRRGIYHSDACCQRAYRRWNAERVQKMNRRYYCKRKGLPMPEEPKQEQMFTVPRPADGKRCHCGRRLYEYERKFGECLHCIQKRNRDWHREPVKLTQAANAAERTTT